MSKLPKKMLPALLMTFTTSLILTTYVGATANGADGSELEATPDLGTGLQSFYMVLKVMFVLAILIGLFFIAIRLLAKRNQAVGIGRPLRSLGGVPLGPNKSIQMVAIGTSLYIVGVGENIQLLDKIDDPEVVAELTEQFTGGGTTVSPQFISVGNWLKRLRQREKPVEEEELPSSSFGHVFQEKLQQISSTKKRTQELLEQHKNSDRSIHDE
ncbi:flagellar biosynthetic protein FliO [Paenibacillus chartarius]|uniref:Flagellar biosynthetic protein FliO n=1 Tax=Paenibacillus chartarius TaxID=747481 RepID=A0ABV6DNY1_9BACL